MCYKKSHFYEEKAQIKWIFFGLFVGLGPYILFNQLPLILKMDSIISEEVSNVFFILIPLAFIFSIVRFKFMNIEFVINRSLVYSLLTIFTISLYLLSIRLFYTLFSRMFAVQESVISVAGALVAAGAFYPARRKIQELVDKAFFRQSYDYRKSTLSFNERAVKIANLGHLIDYFMIKVRNTLPLEYMGIFIYSTDSGKRRLLIKRDGESERSSLDSLRLDPDKILARERAVKTTENIDFSEEIFLQEKNVEVIIPISFKMTALDGLLSVGKKKSGERFSRDDIELLLTMSRELTVNLERIRLQEEVIYEKAEREKLDELSRLKTEFISTVSHELRTPMSSIQGITEMLQEEKIKDRVKRSELLKLIAGESSRLSRFIHNILDFGKIEQQVKTYNFQKKEIQLVIEEVVRLFRYQLDKKGFILSTDLPENPVILEIDEDAVKQALTNLVDNAIKYSSEQKEIDIKLIERKNHIEISVKDKGIG
ncbi:MAG: sensor histidine kinase, partial [Candidatus Aminicenantales bacterium]